MHCEGPIRLDRASVCQRTPVFVRLGNFFLIARPLEPASFQSFVEQQESISLPNKVFDPVDLPTHLRKIGSLPAPERFLVLQMPVPAFPPCVAQVLCTRDFWRPHRSRRATCLASSKRARTLCIRSSIPDPSSRGFLSHCDLPLTTKRHAIIIRIQPPMPTRMRWLGGCIFTMC